MLISTEIILGTELLGSDRSVGSICDLLFDDETWVVRHLVVDTGHWLPGRQVLLPPSVVQNADWNAASAAVPLTSQQVSDSPSGESDRPVSRQMEIELYQHVDQPRADPRDLLGGSDRFGGFDAGADQGFATL